MKNKKTQIAQLIQNAELSKEEQTASIAVGSGSIAGGSNNVAVGKTTPGVSIGISWN
jgi:hypothetical protein